MQQWESTFEGDTDLAWSDSDDAELAALRAEVERATCSCTAPATRPWPPRTTGPREGIVLDLGEAQTSTACVAIASGCAGTGRGTAEEWLYPNLGHRPDNE